MLFLLTLIATQSPAADVRLTTEPAGMVSLRLSDPEPSEGMETDVARVRITNDASAEKLRVKNPLWHLMGKADGFTGCVLWAEGKKPHPLSQPTDGHKDYILFLDADVTLAPGESVDLAIRCEKSGDGRPIFSQALLGPAGVNRVSWLARRAKAQQPLALQTPH